MKDARSYDINEGDTVVLLRTKEMDFGNYSHLAWGTVIRLSKKMVIVDVAGQEAPRAPHNIIVVNLPAK